MPALGTKQPRVPTQNPQNRPAPTSVVMVRGSQRPRAPTSASARQTAPPRPRARRSQSPSGQTHRHHQPARRSRTSSTTRRSPPWRTRRFRTWTHRRARGRAELRVERVRLVPGERLVSSGRVWLGRGLRLDALRLAFGGLAPSLNLSGGQHGVQCDRRDQRHRAGELLTARRRKPALDRAAGTRQLDRGLPSACALLGCGDDPELGPLHLEGRHLEPRQVLADARDQPVASWTLLVGRARQSSAHSRAHRGAGRRGLHSPKGAREDRGSARAVASTPPLRRMRRPDVRLPEPEIEIEIDCCRARHAPVGGIGRSSWTQPDPSPARA